MPVGGKLLMALFSIAKEVRDQFGQFRNSLVSAHAQHVKYN